MISIILVIWIVSSLIISYIRNVDSCRSRKCCFEKTTLANCYKINKDWCDEYTHACHNVDMDNILSNLIGSTGSTSNNIGSTGSTSNNIGSTGSTSSNLNTFLIVCKKDIISIYNNYNQCSTLCKDRAWCFHWGKQNCYDRNEEWCDEYLPYHNLNWVDVAGSNVIEKTSTLITQACSKFNTLYKVGLGRCSALCKDHRCCFDLSVGPCVEKPPNFFYGYEDFSNLLTDSVTLVNEFCSVSKIESVLGYTVCSTLCTLFSFKDWISLRIFSMFYSLYWTFMLLSTWRQKLYWKISRLV
jgi:hypothetical protein